MTAELDLPGIVDPHFERAFAGGVAPGIAYGVVQNQQLVYANGLGTIDVESGPARAPDEATVFSIASMTKSFTAATVLSLRASGLLELDRPAASYLPELARDGWISEVTVRHLLTMAGGFVTDDPWGDRQQSMPRDEFRGLLAVLTPQWSPGRYFEYSNLGYAILGCVIEAVTGNRYPDVVRERVLEPAGLGDSGYHVSELTGRTVATGYVLRGAKYSVEPIADCGAFAPMGGLLSTVEDIARWVALMLAADSGDSTPAELPGRLLREMQTGQRFIESAVLPNEESLQPTLETRHYGFGLMEERLTWGRSIAHSGGYPGYGSHMRWHPASGLGVVAMGNRTYARMSTVATAALADLVADSSPSAVPSLVGSTTLEAALDGATSLVTSLLNDWDDALVPERFASNVPQDEPWELRRADARRTRERHGQLRMDLGAEQVSLAPGHRIWWLVGNQPGRVRCEVLISPEPGEPIQSMNWRSVRDASPDELDAARGALAEIDLRATLGPRQWDERAGSVFSAPTEFGTVEVRVDETGDGMVNPGPVRIRPFDP